MSDVSTIRPRPDFETLFRAAPALCLVLNPELDIVAVSDAYLQATLTQREAILGREVFEVFPDDPDDPGAAGVGALRASLQRVLERKESDTMAVRKCDIRRPGTEGSGDEERYWSAVNSPVFAPDGRELICIIHRVEDVTEFVRLKQRGIEQDKLATELRTPLTLILGPTERLLKQSQFDTETRRQLEGIARNARTLLRHVNNLLDVAWLESGTMAARYTRVDLARLLRLTASHFESLATQRHIVFRVEAPASLTVQVDAEKTQRALLNLLANAFKFAPDGGRVSCRLQADERRVRMTVDDSGAGVAPPLRKLVFERFGGSGLGLAIASELLQLQAGTIRAEDSPLGGARFVVELPTQAPPGVPVGEEEVLPQAQTALVAAELRPAAGADLPADDERMPLALVIEGSRETSRFIADTLSSRCRVACAHDGREGLVRALALKPDVIVSDMTMPRMSGYQLVRGLRLHAALDGVPILLLTARADDALPVELLRAGAQDYLTQPFGADELSARVDNLLALSRARQSMRRELMNRNQEVQVLATRIHELEVALAGREARRRPPR